MVVNKHEWGESKVLRGALKAVETPVIIIAYGLRGVC